MSTFLDIMLGVALVWFLIQGFSRRRRAHPRHVWGELDSAQVVRSLAKRKR